MPNCFCLFFFPRHWRSKSPRLKICPSDWFPQRFESKQFWRLHDAKAAFTSRRKQIKQENVVAARSRDTTSDRRTSDLGCILRPTRNMPDYPVDLDYVTAPPDPRLCRCGWSLLLGGHRHGGWKQVRGGFIENVIMTERHAAETNYTSWAEQSAHCCFRCHNLLNLF